MIILDTNVISEFMRLQPHANVRMWSERETASLFCTTAITKAEMLYGIRNMPKGKKRTRLEEQADYIFSVSLGHRIIPFCSNAAECFADIAVERRRQGKPINEADAQIASIVIVQKAVLATRNIADFEGCGIRLVNPWDFNR